MNVLYLMRLDRVISTEEIHHNAEAGRFIAINGMLSSDTKPRTSASPTRQPYWDYAMSFSDASPVGHSQVSDA